MVRIINPLSACCSSKEVESSGGECFRICSRPHGATGTSKPGGGFLTVATRTNEDNKLIDPLIVDDLRLGAKVTSTDGKGLGNLYAVVVDARDDHLARIVVNTGPFFPAPGFGAPTLVSVPIEEIADAREKQVILKCTKRKFSRMPTYADWSFTKPPTPGVWRME